MAATALVLVTTMIFGTAAVGGAAPARADEASTAMVHDRTVNADPADFTPHVLDGQVYAVAVVGSTVVLGGRFTQVQAAADGSPVLERRNLVAFDRYTGAIRADFHPEPDGDVRTLATASDGTSVYVGGLFSTIDGTQAYKLVRLDATTGARVAGFTPPAIDAAVYDVKLAGSRLFVAGYFTKIGSSTRTHLAELDPTTGALRSGVDVPVAGPMWRGPPGVTKIDISADGARLAMVGSFRSVGGQDRRQLALLDVSGATATVVDWSTKVYSKRCGLSRKLQYDVRDVAFSPDGSYFVTAATGGLAPKGSLCDAAARWEIGPTGAGQQPTWSAKTGNDSVYSVATTGSTIYVGGHFRWFNNPFGIDQPGPGAISRPGIAALDPANGLPLSWNPGRDRGRAVWDLVPTDEGLWIGNDTTKIGGEYHARVAMFPLAGGLPVPQPAVPSLAVDVGLLGPAGAPDGAALRPGFDGTTAGELVTIPGDGFARTAAATLAGDRAYVATKDGELVRYTRAGNSLVDPVEVDLLDLDELAADLTRMTSMAIEDGSLSYTLKGDKQLYRRAFSIQHDVVGAERTSLSGKKLGLPSVTGGFLTADGWFVSSGKGKLSRVDWVAGAPVPGTRTDVSGPKIDGIRWKAGGMVAIPTGS